MRCIGRCAKRFAVIRWLLRMTAQKDQGLRQKPPQSSFLFWVQPWKAFGCADFMRTSVGVPPAHRFGLEMHFLN
jgi:hypothetical protein